ncbi:MAG: hypothetical protein KDJ50_02815 [Alphaproteobacteria bacterium]|nr:hypothetical protein [Alphaproteobacteria bacterium]
MVSTTGLETADKAQRLGALDFTDNAQGIINTNRFDQTDIQLFADGAHFLMGNYQPEDLPRLYKATPEDLIKEMTPGEALITYDIMHNPIMEELASRHATDAMAFANDVMINLAQIERKQMLAQSIGADFEEADDSDLTPEQRARRREQAHARMIEEMAADQHQEHLDDMREQRWQQKWEESNIDLGGGVSLTGWQIDRIIEMLSDPEERKRLNREYAEEHGMSEDEADERLSLAQRYLIAKKKRERLAAEGRLNELTEQDREDLELIRTNPEILEIAQWQEARSNKHDLKNGNDIDVVGFSQNVRSNDTTIDHFKVSSDPSTFQSKFIAAQNNTVETKPSVEVKDSTQLTLLKENKAEIVEFTQPNTAQPPPKYELAAASTFSPSNF